MPLARGTWRIAEAPAELRPAISEADLVVLSMQDALLRELTSALDQGGPTFAINSCHIDVIGITQRVAGKEGVAAGRTSDRLRNRANAPRPWAAPLVRANAGRMTRDVDGFAVDLGDAVGVLRPITQRPMCASCHGPAVKLHPDVRPRSGTAIRVTAPSASQRGEVRGWFWVEVPKEPR